MYKDDRKAEGLPFFLVVRIFVLLLILLLTGSNKLLNSALICHISSFQGKS